jgi:hypothetical protein
LLQVDQEEGTKQLWEKTPATTVAATAAAATHVTSIRFRSSF